MKKIIIIIVLLFAGFGSFAQKADKIEYLRVDSILYSGGRLGVGDTLIMPHPDSLNQYKYMSMADPVDSLDGVNLRTLLARGFPDSLLKVDFWRAPDSIPAYRYARLFRDPTTKALSYFSEFEGVTMNLGQESWIRAINNTGVEISNGEVIYIDTVNASGVPSVELHALTHTKKAELLESPRMISQTER